MKCGPGGGGMFRIDGVGHDGISLRTRLRSERMPVALTPIPSWARRRSAKKSSCILKACSLS